MLKPKQKKCIELLVEGRLKQCEIAETINVSRKTISEWKRNEEFAAALKSALNLSVRSLAPRAIKTMNELLDSGSENVRFMAAKDILDRTGFKPQERVEISKPIDESIKEMEEYLCSRKSEDT